MIDPALPAKIVEAVTSVRSVAELLAVVAEVARELVPAHQAAVTVVAGRWSSAAHAFSLSDKYAAWRTYDENPDGSGIYRLVAELTTPMRLTQRELEAHPAWRGFSAAASRHPPMRGWLAAPLIGRRGRGIGVVQLTDRYEGEFTAVDETALVALAGFTSVTLERIRQTARERRRASGA
ncbi:MAG TPA: GAF domain-containing protein [Methylomirabilota bacterium]|nr:GAF domain-containing protein [Methylomirabilota bacterium]